MQRKTKGVAYLRNPFALMTDGPQNICARPICLRSMLTQRLMTCSTGSSRNT
ncbi:hypothetical protein [Limnohabitans sp.]|jgi:hypothetical protein|uniref:hypothetical protein n=1 Tax=Limnohabitans sp. TaxID=1907725 RepID=UPI00391A08EF